MDFSTPLVQLPRVDDDFADQVLDALLAIREAMPEIHIQIPARYTSTVPRPGDGSEFDFLVPLVEAALDEGDDRITPKIYAHLAMLAVLPGVPEAVALQIAFGPRVGVQYAQKMALLRSAASARALTVDEYVAELAALGRVPRDNLVQLFHGRGRRVPFTGRAKRGAAMLRRLASCVPEGLRPPLLCAVAWLHWARGRRAIAAAYLAESSRIDPENILAFGLAVVVGERLPDWCLDRQELIR